MIKVYGIPNCDTVKKARKLLESNGTDYEFVDFKKESPSETEIKRWKKFMQDWPVNKRGRTFKQYKDEFEDASDAGKIGLIQENTSLIKRPVVEVKGKVVCMGFDEEVIAGL